MSPGALAAEIADALRVGDHDRGLTRRRAAVGLVALAVGALRPRRPDLPVTAADGRWVFVVANPVAHGARLAGAVVRAARESPGPEPVVVADARLADPALGVAVSFPAVGVRSVWRHARLRDLRPALAAARLRDRRFGRLSWWYLVLAQSVRYRLADDAVDRWPGVGTLLVDFDRHTYARPWVRSATRAGWAVATLVHGSPSAETYLPVLAQHVLVWGEAQREFFASRSPGTGTTVVGRPDAQVGVRRAAPTVQRLVVCSSLERLSESETGRLIGAIGAARQEGRRTSLRLHPRQATPDGRWQEVAAAADEVETGLAAPLAEAVGPGDGVVVVASTAAVDALLLGCDVAVVADEWRDLPCDLAEIRSWTEPRPGGAAPTGDARRARVVAATGDEAARRVVRAVAALSPPGR